MNEKFFSLPEEKQQRIINAGFRVFSQNSYRKSPVSEIADAAGISKSLLFYYFKNKRELYVFLWERCAQITIDYLTEYGCYEKMKAFKAENTLKSLDLVQFREGLDLEMMYRNMYLASEGYLW